MKNSAIQKVSIIIIMIIYFSAVVLAVSKLTCSVCSRALEGIVMPDSGCVEVPLCYSDRYYYSIKQGQNGRALST